MVCGVTMGGCNEQEKEERGKLKRKMSEDRKNKERTQRQGYTRETKETHVDTETRTTGNKGGVGVRRRTRTSQLVTVISSLISCWLIVC